MMNLQCSVIVSVYKNYPALQLILDALQLQSLQNFEVIIAEDNNAIDLNTFVQNKHYSFAVKHVSQADNGFRKCAILNKAIAASQSDYLIFIDGDCIPHKKFVQAHWLSKNINIALFGRRVMLSQQFSDKVIANPSILQSPFFLMHLIINQCKRLDAAFYIPSIPPKKKNSIWGCNWSVHKQLLVGIGGFDEQYTKPGIGEDIDVMYRLIKEGVHIYQIKFRAIQYHLWHQENYANTSEMEAILENKKQMDFLIKEK
jgi:glycosyltransferase involved in cell wall biosynthesis